MWIGSYRDRTRTGRKDVNDGLRSASPIPVDSGEREATRRSPDGRNALRNGHRQAAQVVGCGCDPRWGHGHDRRRWPSSVRRCDGPRRVGCACGAVPCVPASCRRQDANGPTRRERVNHTGVGRGSESSGVPGLITPSACPRLGQRRKFPFAPTADVDQMSRRSPVTAEENHKTRLQPLATWLEDL